VSPPSLGIRRESIFEFEASMNITNYHFLDEVIPHLDVLYVTRIQKERFPDTQEYEKVKGTYRIDEKILENAKSDLSIMHPLPRLDEISHTIDNTTNAIYFKQAAYGKELRSALLSLVLNEDPF
jgi:aspartate carbamoyltransferase catalytic subunit